MRRRAREAERPPLTWADMRGPDTEAAAITSAVRAIDGLMSAEARGRVLRYLNDRYRWTLAIAEREGAEARQEAGTADNERTVTE